MSMSLGLVLAPDLGTAIYAVSPGTLWLGCLLAGVVAAALVLVPDRRD
jgi:hypothetical protein